MKPRFPRFALTLPLALLVSGCTTYNVVLLDNPQEKNDHVEVAKGKQDIEISKPGRGVLIFDKFQFGYYAPLKVKEDFAPALDSMSEVLAAGLPELPHSYVALMPIAQGPLGNVQFNSQRGPVVLNQPGQAAYLDGYSDSPYQVDKQQIEKDFKLALASMDNIIQAGFRPTTYIVLLKSPDGTVGKVIVTDAKGSTVIDKEDEAVDMDYVQVGERQFKLKDTAVKEDFGNAIDSRPQLPVTYVLMFKLGSTALAAESREQFDKLLEDVKTRPAPDITIHGHTDTVGGNSINDLLSRKRAETIAKLIRTQGAEPRELEIEYSGKRELAVPTPDNTAELRNRRVEVVVR